jgi:hypothetical protein
MTVDDWRTVLDKLRSLCGKIDEGIHTKVKEILTDSFEECGLFDYDDEIEFLSLATLCSYFELFDNDVNVNDNRQFGYEDVKEVVKSLHGVAQKANSEMGEVERTGSNLLANIRNIDVEGYIDEGLFHEDVEVVKSLIFKQESNQSRLEEQILQNQAIQSAVVRTVTSILSVYEQVMAGGFEIEPYFGVSTLKSSHGVIKVSNGKAKAYKSVALKGLSDILSRFYKVRVSMDRQFNMEQILTSDKPVYFPFKIVEYLFGRVSTRNIQSADYARFDGGSGWERYAESYIKPNLNYFLNKGIKWVVEKNGFVVDGELAFEDEYKDIQVIKQALKKMERSMVTMAIITELESTSSNYENWAQIKIRLVDVVDGLPTNQKLMGTIIKELMDGLGNSGGSDFVIAPETIEDLASYTVYEYEHTFDSKMANLRPLFAYQALDALQAKGETVDWSNIILGKGMNGRTVTSGPGKPINLASQLIHNIIAGSRSGKGVMTLNILSTAIASNRPVFYQDRKPDMAALFAEYVGLNNGTPNMYIVNGSAYEGRFDPHNVLNYDAMVEKWKKRVPAWWDATSYKDIGDIVYYRSILFTLGILLLRFWAETANRELYEKLGGDRGIAIVYDEFTNWQNSFSTKKLNPRGSNSLFGKDMLLNKKNLEEINKAMDEIAELSGVDNLNSRQRSVLRNAENVLRELKTEKRAYVTDMLENLDRTLITLNEKKNAGFKNTEEKRSDIFVIGQNIEVKPLPEGITFSRNQASGGLNADKSYENTCAISNFLYNFSTDWIMGYNRDYKNYMRADDMSSPSYTRLTEEARNFVYYNGSRDAVMGNIAISTLKSNAKYFKPYLILNNAKEPRPLSDDPEERKAQCQQAEYQYVGGIILNTGKEWEKIRQQNLQEGTDELRQEIGFFDYLGQLSRGVATKVDPKASLLQSKQIADMIVKQMGYDGDYLDFLMDLRPEWNFGAQDVVDAFATPEIFKQGIKRMPTYLKLFGNPNENREAVHDNVVLDYVDEDEGFEVVNDGYNDFDSDVNDDMEWNNDNELTDNESNLGIDEGVPSANHDRGSTDPTNGFSDTDYYKGARVGVVENTPEIGVFDPFSSPTVSRNPAPSQPVSGLSNVMSMSLDDIVRALQNQGINAEDVQRHYKEQPFGKVDQVESFGRTVHVGSTGGQAYIEGMRQTATNEEEYYTNYFEFCERVSSDIISTFGGYDGIEVLIVKDGVLYINNIKYNKQIPSIALKGLPIDKQHQIANCNYAHIFNFAHLTKMTRLAYLSLDSKDFVYIKIRQDLGLNGHFDVVSLFKAVPSLFYLSIAGERFQRDTVEDEVAKKSSIFKSARKRQIIAENAEKWGIKTVNNSWDSTKNLYQRKGWAWKLGGTAMLGVTAIAGVGLLGFKGIRAFGKEVKELFKH